MHNYILLKKPFKNSFLNGFLIKYSCACVGVNKLSESFYCF